MATKLLYVLLSVCWLLHLGASAPTKDKDVKDVDLENTVGLGTEDPAEQGPVDDSDYNQAGSGNQQINSIYLALDGARSPWAK